MIFGTNGSVRLTRGELNMLRQANALNGHAVTAIRTRDELMEAALDGLPPGLQSDLLEFLETGRSPLTLPNAPAASPLPRA